jgi:transcriptional regulator with XRE-family HTH domain
MGDLFQLRQPKHLAKLAKSETEMNYLQIRNWRNQIGISQAKAAELLGVDLKTYIDWESDVQPISQPVANACANLNTRYSGTGGQHKALIASIDKYKQAYKVYFGVEPTGKHLVPAEWLTSGFKAIDFNPACKALKDVA